MVCFILNIKTFCLCVIWESKIKFGQKFFASPKIAAPVHLWPTGYHCMFKTFHRRFVNIYRCSFKPTARNGDLKSMGFVHIVTSILVDDSFCLLKLFCFNNTNTSVRSFTFILLTTVLYVQKWPLSKFPPGAPHNLNPPLAGTEHGTGSRTLLYV